jgi:hypothetical protein
MKRGKDLIFCEIDVATQASGKPIAKGTLVYRIAA